MDDKMHKDGMCMACGGMVDADGYAIGGEVDDEAHEAAIGAMEPTDQMGNELERPMSVSRNSSQRADTVRMREFAQSLKGRR